MWLGGRLLFPKAIVNDGFSFSSAIDIHKFFSIQNQKENFKCLIFDDKKNEKHKDMKNCILKIKHSLCQCIFIDFSDRITQCKENIFPFDDYLQDNLLNCITEKCTLQNSNFEIGDDITINIDGQKNEAVIEENELKSNVWLDLVSDQSYIAIYYHENSLEPFYLSDC